MNNNCNLRNIRWVKCKSK